MQRRTEWIGHDPVRGTRHSKCGVLQLSTQMLRSWAAPFRARRLHLLQHLHGVPRALWGDHAAAHARAANALSHTSAPYTATHALSHAECHAARRLVARGTERLAAATDQKSGGSGSGSWLSGLRSAHARSSVPRISAPWVVHGAM